MTKYISSRKPAGKILLLLFCILLGACAVKAPPDPKLVNKETTDSLGIEILGVRFLATDYMMDFRYIVKDPEKSMPMFDRSTIPYLIHEKSGAKFMVPSPAKIGPLRATTRKPEAGKRFFIMFANPGRYVKQGDLVTVVMGDYRFEHLSVQ